MGPLLSSDFDALYSQAIELFKAFPEFQFKTVTEMLVILGWLVSSDTAQKFIKLHSDVALPAGIAAFALLLILKSLWILGHYNRVKALHQRLVVMAPDHGLSAELARQHDIAAQLTGPDHDLVSMESVYTLCLFVKLEGAVNRRELAGYRLMRPSLRFPDCCR